MSKKNTTTKPPLTLTVEEATGFGWRAVTPKNLPHANDHVLVFDAHRSRPVVAHHIGGGEFRNDSGPVTASFWSVIPAPEK